MYMMYITIDRFPHLEVVGWVDKQETAVHFLFQPQAKAVF